MFHVHSEQYLVIYVMCIQIRAVSLLDQCFICIHTNIWLFILYAFKAVQLAHLIVSKHLYQSWFLQLLKTICLIMHKPCDYMIISANLRNQWCWLPELNTLWANWSGKFRFDLIQVLLIIWVCFCTFKII